MFETENLLWIGIGVSTLCEVKEVKGWVSPKHNRNSLAYNKKKNTMSGLFDNEQAHHSSISDLLRLGSSILTSLH